LVEPNCIYHPLIPLPRIVSQRAMESGGNF
jgi:hypothetical protein